MIFIGSFLFNINVPFIGKALEIKEAYENNEYLKKEATGISEAAKTPPEKLEDRNIPASYSTANFKASVCSVVPDSSNVSAGRLMTDWYSRKKPTSIYDQLGDDVKIHVLNFNAGNNEYTFNVKGNDGQDCKLVVGSSKKALFRINNNIYALNVLSVDEKKDIIKLGLDILRPKY